MLIEDIDTARHRLDVRAKGGGGDVTHTVHVPTEAWELLVPYAATDAGGIDGWRYELDAHAHDGAPFLHMMQGRTREVEKSPH